MPRQNRVTPFGEIVAHPARGLMMGNRGCIHGPDGRLGRARWRTPHWICCVTEFRGRRVPFDLPGRYTPLFFLDEATALAAGHRPCAECRREAFRAFRAAWETALGGPAGAVSIDRDLHAERVEGPTGRRRIHERDLAELPDGAMVALPAKPTLAWLVRGAELLPWSPEGYGTPVQRPADVRASVLTPPSTVAALAAGYRPILHPSAQPGPRGRQPARPGPGPRRA
jgi:hypothetical protein